MPVDPDVYRRQARHLAYVMNNFILWQLSRLYGRFDGDLECALILGEIAHYNAETIFRHYQASCPDMEQHLIQSRESLKRCNTLSISTATGIPRETVRRKIQWLERRGWISRDAKGRLLVTPAPVEEFMDFNLEALERFLATAERLRRILRQSSSLHTELPLDPAP